MSVDLEKQCLRCDRCGFFAALLAPLVVPWHKTGSLVERVLRSVKRDPVAWARAVGYTPIHVEAQRRMNGLYNSMLDNIYLSHP